MTELGQQPSMTNLVESHLFNSSKCFALFPPAHGGGAVAAKAEAATA